MNATQNVIYYTVQQISDKGGYDESVTRKVLGVIYDNADLHEMRQALREIKRDLMKNPINENFEEGIVWCKFLYSLNQIADILPGCARYCGDLSEQQRQAEIERFRGDGCRFLVATQATGGHGLTLNEATYHVFYENEFKYSHRIQAEDRSHRIGQARQVTYIDLVSNTGIDRRIQAALEKKQDVVRKFRQDVKRHKDIDL